MIYALYHSQLMTVYLYLTSLSTIFMECILLREQTNQLSCSVRAALDGIR